MQSIGIVGVGAYLPETVITNTEIARDAGVTDEWIVRKTGIRERRRAAAHEATSDLAAEAARHALARAGISANQVSCIVVATSTPDYPQPATAAIVQNLIGNSGAAAFDINTACSGFIHALKIAERLLSERTSDAVPYGLVIGADIYSRILDYRDRRTAILFGDGAGAAVLGPVAPGFGMLRTTLVSHGDAHRLILVTAGGSRCPASYETLKEGGHYFQMNGRGVREFVHQTLPGEIRTLLRETGTSAAAIQHFVPHQANGVMLAELWPELALDSAALHLTVEKYANTGAASVPVTLAEMDRADAADQGDLVLLAAFGGGMSIGITLLNWSMTALNQAPTAMNRSSILHTPAS